MFLANLCDLLFLFQRDAAAFQPHAIDCRRCARVVDVHDQPPLRGVEVNQVSNQVLIPMHPWNVACEQKIKLWLRFRISKRTSVGFGIDPVWMVVIVVDITELGRSRLRRKISLNSNLQQGKNE